MNDNYKDLSTERLIQLVIELKVDFQSSVTKTEKDTIKNHAFEIIEEINFRKGEKGQTDLINWDKIKA